MRHIDKKIKFIVFAFCMTSAFAQQFIKYDTRNEPKAKGLWITVKYPSNWRAEAGNRPNIVQKFSYGSGSIFEGLMLQVKDIPEEASTEIANLSTKDWSEIIGQIESNTRVSSVRKIKHEGEPGFIADVTVTNERAGILLYQSTRIMTVFYKNKLVSQYCSVGGFPNEKSTIDLKQKMNVQTVCQLFFNSLVFMDKYT